MKLQKQLSRKTEKKEYPKWIVVIPPILINKLKWKAGEDLEAETKEDRLVIKKKV